MQLTLENPLDDRHTQAADPGLGFSSALTKETKPNEHDQIASQAIRPIGTVPLPWHVVYQFGRIIWLGIVVTFGGELLMRDTQRDRSYPLRPKRIAMQRTAPTLPLHTIATSF